jgi:hypothetical protein
MQKKYADVASVFLSLATLLISRMRSRHDVSNTQLITAAKTWELNQTQKIYKLPWLLKNLQHTKRHKYKVKTPLMPV